MSTPLTDRQLAALAKAVADTHHAELSCTDLADRLAAYIDGAPITPDERTAIERHLLVCSECNEELQAVLRAMNDDDDAGAA